MAHSILAGLVSAEEPAAEKPVAEEPAAEEDEGVIGTLAEDAP